MAERTYGFDHLPRAIYLPAQLPEHAGNPLIEALPPYRLIGEIPTGFGQFPSYSKAERDLPDGLRTLKITRLRDWLEPLPHHEQVINMLGAMVRSGYAGRDPNDPHGHKRRVAFYRQVMEEGYMLPLNAAHPSTAPSMALFGTSGVGKTSVVEFSLRALLPQVIYHESGGFAQVVWLKLDCPPDGSLKQFLLAIIAQIDTLLLTTYRVQIGRVTADELMLFVAKLCVMHNVGLIVIDEIQNLLFSKTPRETMLNFFVSMSNEARVPILTMGTVLAMKMLTGTFRQARRTGEMGTIIWDRMEPGADWGMFVDGMQRYQWVKGASKLDAKFRNVLHDETLGIPALVVRLFQLAQIEAIADGSECLTTDLVSRVAAQRFALLQPMLSALRKGGDVERWEDLFRVTVGNLDDMLDDKADPLTTNKDYSSAREKALATLRLTYGRNAAVRVVDDLLASEPGLRAHEIVDRTHRALDGEDTRMDAMLPPPLAQDLANAHADGSGLQAALYEARRQRKGKKAKAD